jgi:hypothetical protein
LLFLLHFISKRSTEPHYPRRVGFS